ncbi:L-threonine 3-dehydrogenase-like isoform X1 [Montipora foliosa]|uniref:L-threonine 3-dehydrogenase-like isoform X1 n=1 Tax=Montipora foliosa TaxID=591990 RepID=UPI0035F11044
MFGGSNRARRVVFLGSHVDPFLIQEEVPIPELKSGEILGKIRMATICGSDLHTISGRRKEAVPSILGHEGVIELIEHKRPADSGLKKGDRLTFHVVNCCGKCERCKDGLQQKCLSLFKYGHAAIMKNSELNGCYASHIIIHSGTHVVKVPDHLQDRIASPINCALATMISAVSGLNGRGSNRETSAFIQGCGLLGIYGCVLLREAGFNKVFCSDVNVDRLDMVQKFGGIPLQAGQRTSEGPEDSSVDVVIEVCGVRDVIREGITLVRPGGLYVLIGMVHPDSKLDLTGEQIIRKCITIKGIHNYSPQHLDKAVSFLSRTYIKYPYKQLFSQPFKLADFQTALKLAQQQKFYRVCVVP